MLAGYGITKFNVKYASVCQDSQNICQVTLLVIPLLDPNLQWYTCHWTFVHSKVGRPEPGAKKKNKRPWNVTLLVSRLERLDPINKLAMAIVSTDIIVRFVFLGLLYWKTSTQPYFILKVARNRYLRVYRTWLAFHLTVCKQITNIIDLW